MSLLSRIKSSFLARGQVDKWSLNKFPRRSRVTLVKPDKFLGDLGIQYSTCLCGVPKGPKTAYIRLYPTISVDGRHLSVCQGLCPSKSRT